ncbi:hypothetical protein JGU66_33930 [Myxococcaceae bacterium JPH2]|nr:hypothetical protein [Myxococcaceae bacterium JPH2]
MSNEPSVACLHNTPWRIRSQDALVERFRRVVGAAPKQLASIIRVRHAVGPTDRA